MDARYYLPLAAAFVRGRLGARDGESDEAAVARGVAEGLRVHKFKRNVELPRVRRVLGVLRGFAPARLLDVGSGRGTFLWPMMDAFPTMAVLAVDLAERRVLDFGAVARGGITRLSAARMDAGRLALAPASVDGVTMLEVLEHLPDPAKAAAEALRVARRFVVASVPSHEDDNPEHLHLFDEAALSTLFAGARRVAFEHVLNHLICIVQT